MNKKLRIFSIWPSKTATGKRWVKSRSKQLDLRLVRHSLQGITLNSEDNSKLKCRTNITHLLGGMNLFYRTLHWVSNERGQASFSNKECTAQADLFLWLQVGQISCSTLQLKFGAMGNRVQVAGSRWEFIYLSSEDRVFLLNISKIETVWRLG